MNFAS